MSYDYQALVQTLASHRQEAYPSVAAGVGVAAAGHDDNDNNNDVNSSNNNNNNNNKINLQALGQAVDVFATLSQHCPMTPLLWMQYAHDAARLVQEQLGANSAASVRCSTLQLGLQEFPGSAFLRLHYLQLLMEQQQQQQQQQQEKEKQHKEEEESEEAQIDIQEAFRESLASVGRGSHRNEDDLVAHIYRLYVDYLVNIAKQPQEAKALFLQRAKTPMRQANDALAEEYRVFCQQQLKQHDSMQPPQQFEQSLEEARRWTSRTFGMLATWEDEVDAAMHAEGILTRRIHVGFSTENNNNIDWTRLLIQEDASSSTHWNGLGGNATALAFQRYAQTCARYHAATHHDNEEDDSVSQQQHDHQQQQEQLIRSLAAAVYERGVAECPTVESIWTNYIKHLMYLVKTGRDAAHCSQLQGACSRAIRNCPYSVTLVQLRLQAMLVLAEAGQAVLDPDALLRVVTEAVGAKFFTDPSQHLQVYLTAIQTVKRRIMSLLCSVALTTEQNGNTATTQLKYDDSEPLSSKKKSASRPSGDAMALELDSAVEEEIQDLVEDLHDMYDTTDAFLRKEHSAWSEGRTLLWKDRALTEAFLLTPLVSSLQIDNDVTSGASGAMKEESLKCFDKLVRVQQPPHPDSCALHIQAVLNRPCVSPGQVLQKLRTARALYQKALVSVGKPKGSTVPSSSQLRDRPMALHCLCHEYLEFEKTLGSDESYAHATKAVQKKLTEFSPERLQPPNGHAVQVAAEPASKELPGTKRKLSSASSEEEPSAKRSKPSLSTEKAQTAMDGMATEKTQEPKPGAIVQQKHPAHKVKVGKLEYPAHPFTVRVTNLSPETQDMDLVDVFRSKCGAVVHAKIVREKHFHGGGGKGKSKGWGLVQFDDRESVEKALELHDVVGIHDKVIQVERSHVPAVGLVPPGMHRVNPKAEGKSSKRNLKKRDQKATHAGEIHHNNTSQEAKAEAGNEDEQQAPEKVKQPPAKDQKTGSGPGSGILAFRPRGVAHGHKHRKVKLSIAGDDKAKK